MTDIDIEWEDIKNDSIKQIYEQNMVRLWIRGAAKFNRGWFKSQLIKGQLIQIRIGQLTQFLRQVLS